MKTRMHLGRAAGRLLGAGAILAAVTAPVAGALQAQSPDGYLLGQPRATITVKGLWDQPRAEGSVYDHATDFLTLASEDFAAPGVAVAAAIRVHDRFDIVLEGGFARSEAVSEFRDFVEETPTGDLPIVQETAFRRSWFELSGRFFPLARGRSLGNFAWIPARFSPYLGAGLGRTGYRFEQVGDFVDYNDLSIFYDQVETSGSGWTGQAYGGVEFDLGQRFLLDVAGRWGWGSLPVGGDFRDPLGPAFEDIDLSRFQLTFGIGVRL